MARNDWYHPDYRKLYPGIEKRPDILAVLRKSDRKMKYIEVDLKTERFVQNQRDTPLFLPSREDSLERLLVEEHAQFHMDEAGPEEQTIRADTLRRLRSALQELEPEEADLIHALFYKGLSERQLSKKTGIPQRTIHDRKRKILAKLHKLLEK